MPLTPRRGGTGTTDQDDRERRSLPSVRLSQMRVRFLPLLRPRPADGRALWQAQPLPTPILDGRPVPFAQGFRLGRHPRSPPMVSAGRGCRRVARGPPGGRAPSPARVLKASERGATGWRSRSAGIGRGRHGAGSRLGQRQHVLSLWRIGVGQRFDQGTVRRAAQRLPAPPGA